MKDMIRVAVASCCLLATSGAVYAQEKLKIGVMATLAGALTSGGEDGVRGVQIAAKLAGN